MIYIGIIVGIFILDFFIKNYVDKHIPLKKQKNVYQNKILIEKYYNSGAAFNLLESYPKRLKGIQSLLIVVVAVWFYIMMRRQGEIVQKVGLSFLIGGGFSNLFDRYTKGHVVDYVRFGFGPKWFRRLIFNISDFFVFVGGLFIVLGQ